MKHLAGVFAFAALLSASGALAADDACTRAEGEGERLRAAGKLTAAKKPLAACAKAECDAELRGRCAHALAEVDAGIATVVLSAHDSSGRELTDVRVELDGETVPRDRAREPVELDPGEHLFRFERPSTPGLEERVVVHGGERRRPVDVSFPAPAPPAEPSAARAGVPAGAYVLGALGIVALGSALYFRLTMDSDVNNLRATCAPACDQSQRDAVSAKLESSNISFGAGLLAVGGAVAWGILGSASSGPAASVVPARSGGLVQLSSPF
jgi:hypothetical protein